MPECAKLKRLTYSPAEVGEVLGISRPSVYTLLRRDDFPKFKLGTRTLVPEEGLREWVRRQAEAEEANAS